MSKESDSLKIKETVTSEDKQILKRALDGINGWNFSPIVVVTDGAEDYYFICSVKSLIKNLKMKMAKVYIKIQKGNEPRLLSIEKIK
jgi:hypothetical protein